MVAASAVRQHILTDLKQKFKTVDDAEDALGLPLEAYLDDSILSDRTTPSPAQLNVSQTLLDKLNHSYTCSAKGVDSSVTATTVQTTDTNHPTGTSG